MIAYSELGTLEDEQQERVQSLFERSSTIWDLPEDEGKLEVWDEFIEDCERAEFPHLIASARFGQYTTLVKAGLGVRALDAYVRLMQVIHRHGDLIAPENVNRMLNSIATASMTLVDDPVVPLEQITRAIDLVEQQIRQRGADIVGVYVARATVSAARGEAEATLDWIQRWRSENSIEWRPDDSGVIQMELPLVARFDLPRATVTLEQRLRMLEIDPRAFDEARSEAVNALPLLVMLAFFYVRAGRRADANLIADQLLEGVGSARLARDGVAEFLIPVLEERPDAALASVDHTLRNLHLDGSDWEATAAVARSRILADPTGEEGKLLRALAGQSAAALDRRGGTDVHSRELETFWWAGLPTHPRPTLVDDPEVWGDVEERAEAILAAGWLPRTASVSSEDPPISIKHRYVAHLGDTMELLSAETPEDADALAASLTARSEQLKCASTRYCVPLLHGLRAGQQGRIATLVRDFRSSQTELLRAHDAIEDAFQAIGERFFAVTVEQAVASPDVAWSEIEELIQTETRLREVTGGPLAHLSLARAEIAAHRDDGSALRAAVEQVQHELAAEEKLLDRVSVDLEVVRLTALVEPAFAAATAKRVLAIGDAEQIRAATAWLCWLDARSGDRAASAELVRLLESVDGDVTEFGPLPGWVLLEGIAAPGADFGRIIDALLDEVDESPSELMVLAACGSALLATSPDDPRGPRLRSRVADLTRGLDARNGDDGWSTWVRDRWFPGDTSFGVSA
ncbi:hypothetical protein HDC34_001543 [Pseudoclavibacter sp. JAI123]|uniref:hypothetical protein n=1 Tax=Pseudoclavibacter sp. JAI123 TaxID=2723065 RepID=UPI0015C9BA1B|nr:hypothetical protein [Pseudoclavibacter sp. JAI123]NYF13249.1 hypothetical protein [Pseudoclavibacter sp. JAI123]